MYINPILAGSLITILVELVIVLCLGVKFATRGDKKK